MKKLEPGMLCRYIQPGSRDHGKIVTLLEEVGRPPLGEYKCPPLKMAYDDDYWRVDTQLQSPSRELEGPFARTCRLQPINPDHQPADEEWQADFKRLLCGDRQTAKG